MDIAKLFHNVREIKDTVYWIESSKDGSIRLGVLEESNCILKVSADRNYFIFQCVVETEHNRYSLLHDLEYSVESIQGKQCNLLMQEIKDLLQSNSYISYRDSNYNRVLDNTNRFIKTYLKTFDNSKRSNT